MPRTYKNKDGYPVNAETGRLRHIEQAEKKVGGKIYSTHEVHHKDKDLDNYRLDNLAVLEKEFHQRVVHKKKQDRW